ncbi:MAG: efflux RND transporter periplasmic adaptor subunit [Polyangiales bacterium]
MSSRLEVNRVGRHPAAPLERALGVGLLCLAATSCRQGNAAATQPTEDPPIQVATETVTKRPMPRYLELTGTLTPNQSSDVAADTTGKILSTDVERGSLVEKLQVVARVDPRTAGLQAAEAGANFEAAVSQEKQALADCDRAEKLYASGSIAGAEYDRQKLGCTVALSTAKAAKIRVQSATKGIGDTSIRAPFAGMIAERYVSAGEYVRPDTKVARVVAIDPLRLELSVSESAVGSIREGQPVDFHVSAFEKDSFKGSIRYIGPSLRPGSRDLLVEAVVPNVDRRLRPGMFATAAVDLGDAPTLTIPKSAVRVDGSLHRIFVVKDGHVEERLARLGVERDDRVAVEEGLVEGEVVVAPLGAQVHDGARVK